MKKFLSISINIILCYTIEDQSSVFVYFNYVKIENSIPILIRIVNHTDHYDYILLSFDKQNIMKNDNQSFQANSCQRNQSLSVPYGFYCKIPHWHDLKGIIFFDDQCLLLNQIKIDCIKEFIQALLTGHRHHIDEFFKTNSKKKICRFESATSNHQLINFATTTVKEIFKITTTNRFISTSPITYQNIENSSMKLINSNENSSSVIRIVLIFLISLIVIIGLTFYFELSRRQKEDLSDQMSNESETNSID